MIARTIRSICNTIGVGVSPLFDMGKDFRQLYRRCAPYSMTSIERLYATHIATEYIVSNRIPGAIVECGVWRGGNMMMSAMTLIQKDDRARTLYLYDTFEGNSAPTAEDVDFRGRRSAAQGLFCASLEEVRKHLSSTSYPQRNIEFVKGRVEDTIPRTLPERIALLRLDTDWYESTLHELRHCYPLLSPGGVLIIDDFGHWRGARKATEQYFHETKTSVFLQRIDYTGRMGVKIG